jgi:cellulose synthase/poly-beta-1,6-N-acetylglucosamine synthase-like glycosyltransferase
VPVLLTLECIVIGFIAYTALTALFGWPDPIVPPRGALTHRIRVVVPAHDEGHVVGALLADLHAQQYPPPLITTWVIADRCRDDTAGIAASAGAAVDVRSNGAAGKGAALRWHLDRHPLEDGEALVVLDADNRVPPGLLARFSDELDAGGEALQAYLDVSNPDASLLTTTAAVSYWASNRMVQQARRRLNWPADLGGTGMCVTADALTRAGGFGESLTEDTDLGVRLALVGVPVRWLHDIHVADEKPQSVKATVGQRARWAAGKRAAARHHLPALLGAALSRRSAGLLDLAIRLVQPGRTLIALLSGVAFVIAWLAAPTWLLPAPVWLAAAGLQFALPIAFLLRDRIALRYVVRYPLLIILGMLWFPIRIASRLGRGWHHTPHRGDNA